MLINITAQQAAKITFNFELIKIDFSENNIIGQYVACPMSYTFICSMAIS